MGPNSWSFSEEWIAKVNLISLIRYILSDLMQFVHISVFSIRISLFWGTTDAKIITNNMFRLEEVFEHGFGLNCVCVDIFSSRSIAVEAQEAVHPSLVLDILEATFFDWILVYVASHIPNIHQMAFVL